MSDDFVSDLEIARRWGVGEKTARVAIREFERRPGFPKRDPMFGDKRYWPAVRAFMANRYGLSMASATSPDDGEEPWNATPTAKNRQRPRPMLAAPR